ncbi:MAG: type II toxin-antitoxin system VapC family toxin [Dehalococcoidia bacterium]|nr:type II toxin-antitoxin system VapC family toxin [Dehalococcoidia bacterium]
MASYYFDTSSLVKAYLREDGSDVIIGLVDNLSGGRISILEITLLEAQSTVRRHEREGSISGRAANRILERIDEDAVSSYIVKPFDALVIEEAIRVLDTHPLKTLDALQLAGCLMIGRSMSEPLTFVCADTRLNDAARLEGLVTLNPLNVR